VVPPRVLGVKRHRQQRALRGSLAAMTLSTDIADFRRRDMTFAGKTRTVLTTGAIGPAIVVMHEIFGFTPPLARFCRWLRHGGFRVYAPILLGTPDATNPETVTLGRTIGLCISHEFTMLAANKSSPITNWLKALARQAHTECGGPGVGAIGMCLTGGFALAMAVDPVIMAPVLSQPGLPALNHAALDLSPAELAQVKARTAGEGLCVRGYRFEGDPLSRAERFATLRREFGDAFIGVELPDACGNPAGMKARGKPPHSVFTGDLIDAAGEPTRHAVDEVIAFFRERLVPSEA
jgi:dienelactone hydrolase